MARAIFSTKILKPFPPPFLTRQRSAPLCPHCACPGRLAGSRRKTYRTLANRRNSSYEICMKYCIVSGIHKTTNGCGKTFVFELFWPWAISAILAEDFSAIFARLTRRSPAGGCCQLSRAASTLEAGVNFRESRQLSDRRQLQFRTDTPCEWSA